MKRNKLVNRVIVESEDGDRAFLLLEGNILAEPSDVYVFNSYADQQKAGDLVDGLKDFYQEGIIPESPFYYSESGLRVGKLELEDGRIVLLLHADVIEHEPITIEQYMTYIDVVFASLTALEAYGCHFESLALPVLVRNGLENIHVEAIKILIEKATAWLKTSANTKVIKYVLFESNDAELWNDNLEMVLGHRIMHVNEDSRLYQNKALALLQRFDQNLSYWDDTLIPIRDALQSRDLRPEVLAAFSRKLLEVFCHDLNESTNSDATSLEGYLSYIRRNKLLNDWDVQTLYQIRSFGNPSIHRPDPAIGPKAMNEKDITILLLSLCKLLNIVYEFIQTKYTYSFYAKQ